MKVWPQLIMEAQTTTQFMNLIYSKEFRNKNHLHMLYDIICLHNIFNLLGFDIVAKSWAYSMKVRPQLIMEAQTTKQFMNLIYSKEFRNNNHLHMLYDIICLHNIFNLMGFDIVAKSWAYSMKVRPQLITETPDNKTIHEPDL